jgi:PRTRC genetic system ThiF family protein
MTTDCKTPMHFADNELVQTVHPILINVIGTGGTGNNVLRLLADMNAALWELGHPGLVIRAFDDDKVTRFNLGRQRFAPAEIGESKAEAMINRINRFYGTYWQAMLHPYSSEYEQKIAPFLSAQITISCVDNVPSRFDIEGILKRSLLTERENARQRATYWMDFGNSQYSGQVFLSTLAAVKQPESNLYTPVAELPLFTEEYRNTLSDMKGKTGPSCSMREALSQQSLYINPSLATMGCNLLWTLISEGMTHFRGFFLNLANYKIAPIPVSTLAIERQLSTHPLVQKAA